MGRWGACAWRARILPTPATKRFANQSGDTERPIIFHSVLGDKRKSPQPTLQQEQKDLTAEVGGSEISPSPGRRRGKQRSNVGLRNFLLSSDKNASACGDLLAQGGTRPPGALVKPEISSTD